MEKISFGGTLTPEEYVSALYLHISPHKFMSKFLVAIAVIYGVLVIAYGSHNFSPIETTVLVFPLFVLLIWKILIYPNQVSRLFLEQPGLQKTYHFEADDIQLKMSVSSQEKLMDWSGFTSVRANASLTLLYRSESEFFIFPHRWFESGDDRDYFMNCLSNEP